MRNKVESDKARPDTYRWPFAMSAYMHPHMSKYYTHELT